MILDLNMLKSMLSIDNDNTEYDDILNMIIDSTEKFTETYTGLKLVREIKEFTFFGNGNNRLYIQPPLNSIKSVIETPIMDYVNTLSNDITDNVSIADNEIGLVYRNDNMLFYENYKYLFTVDVGYDEVPSDLLYAMYQLAVVSYSLIDNLKHGVSRLSTPDGNMTYSFKLLPESIRMIFDLYKRR